MIEPPDQDRQQLLDTIAKLERQQRVLADSSKVKAGLPRIRDALRTGLKVEIGRTTVASVVHLPSGVLLPGSR